jgi:hypothetical protein
VVTRYINDPGFGHDFKAILSFVYISCHTMANLANPAHLGHLVVVEGVEAAAVAAVEVVRGRPVVQMVPPALMARLVGFLLIQEMPVILGLLAGVVVVVAAAAAEVVMIAA